jgi:hypothetical protein
MILLEKGGRGVRHPTLKNAPFSERRYGLGAFGRELRQKRRPFPTKNQSSINLDQTQHRLNSRLRTHNFIRFIQFIHLSILSGKIPGFKVEKLNNCTRIKGKSCTIVQKTVSQKSKTSLQEWRNGENG